MIRVPAYKARFLLSLLLFTKYPLVTLAFFRSVHQLLPLCQMFLFPMVTWVAPISSLIAEVIRVTSSEAFLKQYLQKDPTALSQASIGVVRKTRK